MIDWPILSLTTFLPLLGVLFILLVPGDDEGSKKNIRMVALVTTGVTFLLSLFIWGNFDYANPGFQF
ncbi:MAG: NADH-quinone oxidoreductase subunit M, partial [Roseibium sp.]|nr:NADH-quinone oxidoreductase subunit M [Roseibium sp.]